MEKAIEYRQANLVECDYCDFTVPNPTGDINEPVSMYINIPCPVCGANLLTYEDFAQSEIFRKKVNFMNKWFSWLTIFTKRRKETIVKIHEGVHVKEVEPTHFQYFTVIGVFDTEKARLGWRIVGMWGSASKGQGNRVGPWFDKSKIDECNALVDELEATYGLPVKIDTIVSHFSQ